MKNHPLYRLFQRAVAVFRAGAALALALPLAGCFSPDYAEEVKSLKFRSALHYELTPSMVASAAVRDEAVEAVFPVTKRRFRLNGIPQIDDNSFAMVEPAWVGPREAPVPGLVVRLKERAARAFNYTSLSLMKEGAPHVFLRVNDQLVGIHTIVGENPRGVLFFHMELPAKNAEELHEKIADLCRDMNASILVLRKAAGEGK